MRTPMGLALAPRRDGKVLTPDVFKALPAGRARSASSTRSKPSRPSSRRRCARCRNGNASTATPCSALNRETTGFAIAHHMDELRAGYSDLPDGRAAISTRSSATSRRTSTTFWRRPRRRRAARRSRPVVRSDIEDTRFRRYQVNVIVDNGGQHGAPVVYEDNPTHQTLVGRVEHLARFGALVTDFNLLSPGALHRANGGYLVLDAQKLMTGNFGWASLKRALEAGEIRIETLEQVLSLASTVSLAARADPARRQGRPGRPADALLPA